MKYLLDTNVISELARSKSNKKVLNWFEQIPSDELYISVLTLGEIRKGIETVSDQPKKEKLRVWLEQELIDWLEDRILEVDKHVADTWGRLLSKSRNSLPAIDSLIAATALNYNLALVTRNTKDFQFSLLEVINPWEYSS